VSGHSLTEVLPLSHQVTGPLGRQLSRKLVHGLHNLPDQNNLWAVSVHVSGCRNNRCAGLLDLAIDEFGEVHIPCQPVSFVDKKHIAGMQGLYCCPQCVSVFVGS
jgi:hypothetical protein